MDPVTTPNPPPEGEALERARQRARLSQREAARRADISETRWRQITKGHHIAGGVAVPDYGPAETIARMALAVGLTPEELDATGRDDALIFMPLLQHMVATPATDTPQNLTDIPDDALLAELGRRLAERHGAPSGNPTPTIKADLNFPSGLQVAYDQTHTLAARRGDTDD